ncbi:hypothetical protein ACJJTC_009299 [Scirpophaga incertulas]
MGTSAFGVLALIASTAALPILQPGVLFPTPYSSPNQPSPDVPPFPEPYSQPPGNDPATLCGDRPIRVFLQRSKIPQALRSAGFQQIAVPGGNFFITASPDILIQPPPILVRPRPLTPITPPTILVQPPQNPSITPKPIIVRPPPIAPITPPPITVRPPSIPPIRPPPIVVTPPRQAPIQPPAINIVPPPMSPITPQPIVIRPPCPAMLQPPTITVQSEVYKNPNPRRSNLYYQSSPPLSPTCPVTYPDQDSCQTSY